MGSHVYVDKVFLCPGSEIPIELRIDRKENVEDYIQELDIDILNIQSDIERKLNYMMTRKYDEFLDVGGEVKDLWCYLGEKHRLLNILRIILFALDDGRKVKIVL